MEGLTRLVAESLARHGFDRPLDYRRLHWSRWFRCESPHSLLFVPSKPGVFAIAEEIMDLDRVGTEPSAPLSADRAEAGSREPGAESRTPEAERRKPEAEGRRMLAVTQFFEADDMAFVLDRMLSRPNPMQPRLASGRYFVRFVVIEDSSQRRSICGALNQWMVSTAEKATGIGSHFASSLELTPSSEYVSDDAQAKLFGDAVAMPAGHISGPSEASAGNAKPAPLSVAAPQLDSGAATNIHCPSPFPSGF
jgi:hypothetical protein